MILLLLLLNTEAATKLQVACLPQTYDVNELGGRPSTFELKHTYGYHQQGIIQNVPGSWEQQQLRVCTLYLSCNRVLTCPGMIFWAYDIMGPPIRYDHTTATCYHREITSNEYRTG